MVPNGQGLGGGHLHIPYYEHGDSVYAVKLRSLSASSMSASALEPASSTAVLRRCASNAARSFLLARTGSNSVWLGGKTKLRTKSRRSTLSLCPITSFRCSLQNRQKSSAWIITRLAPRVSIVFVLNQPRSIHCCTFSGRTRSA